MENLTELQSRAWGILKNARIGQEITGKSVLVYIGLKPRANGKEGADMRSIIHALRIKGYPICANGDGYYTARTRKEIDEYCGSLSGRISEMSEALIGLKKSQPIFELKQQERIWEL